MTTWRWMLGFAVLGTAAIAHPGDALACGGCFAPPRVAQVVTAHRMVLSLSSTQTTLWDQFEYSGRPEDFSWILPIRYTDRTRVELASDDFVSMLARDSAPRMIEPTPPPYPPGCMPPGGGGAASDAGIAGAPARSDSPAPDLGVTVLRQEVVGPYALSVLRGMTGTGLRQWLQNNNYALPPAIEPVLDHYVALGMDFVALRLRPGEGVPRMVPVRVSVEGNQPRLPLRMIAAGVADRVGLTLMTVSTGRMEAMNFPNGELSDADFTWDWNARPTDTTAVFRGVFDARNRANGERLWLTESAQAITREAVLSGAMSLPRRTDFASDGGPAAGQPEDDARRLFEGLGERATLTRLRANLPAAMLGADLSIAASDRGARDVTYRFGSELNRPMYSRCPWGDPPVGDSGTMQPIDSGMQLTTDVGVTVVPADGGATPVTNPADDGGRGCAVRGAAPAKAPSEAFAVAALGLALAAVRRRRHKGTR